MWQSGRVGEQVFVEWASRTRHFRVPDAASPDGDNLALVDDVLDEPAQGRPGHRAGRAVVLALAQREAGAITVVNRTRTRGELATALAPGLATVGGLDDVNDADLVVNATPVGMDGESSLFDLALFRPGQLVVDLVYQPPTTPLMAAARGQGAAAVNGLGMLIHQAGHQFRLWTGEEPPLAVMSAAVLRALAARG